MILMINNTNMKRILFLSAVLCLSMLSNAQDIKGVSGEMTKSGVIALFGTPEKYENNVNERDETYEYYYYNNKERLIFIDGILSEYSIRTSRFTMFPNLFQGGVKVGDPFSRIESRCSRESTDSERGVVFYDCEMNDPDAYVHVRVKDDKIISFYYLCPM